MYQKGWTIEDRPQYPGALLPCEQWWSMHQKYLEDAGYMLRPRYHQDWLPSWHGTNQRHRDVEDGQMTCWGAGIMDATRMSDGAFVMLKRHAPEDGPYELDMNGFLALEMLASDPSNHCAPLLDVVELPGDESEKLLVMPLLRPFHDPPFRTFGEVAAFIGQIFEAVQFMHRLHIAHRDCTVNNIMLDPTPMYPHSFHPCERSQRRDFKGKAKHYSRTWRPPRYYLIDFSLSRQYNPMNGPALDEPLQGGDRTAPERRNPNSLCDPFCTDVYDLGNLIRQQFVFKYYGFEFMMPLVNDMIQKDPSQRPDIDEVVVRFEKMIDLLGGSKLRSRIVGRRESMIPRAFRAFWHMFRTAGYIIAGKAAIPMPEESR